MPRYLDELDTPRVVTLILERLHLPTEERARVQRRLNCSFHFGGLMLLTQPDGQRERIVASGLPDELGPVFDHLLRDGTEKEVTVDLPDPFAEVVYAYASRFRREAAEKRP